MLREIAEGYECISLIPPVSSSLHCQAMEKVCHGATEETKSKKWKITHENHTTTNDENHLLCQFLNSLYQ
jgi:hypothetical protein